MKEQGTYTWERAPLRAEPADSSHAVPEQYALHGTEELPCGSGTPQQPQIVPFAEESTITGVRHIVRMATPIQFLNTIISIIKFVQ